MADLSLILSILFFGFLGYKVYYQGKVGDLPWVPNFTPILGHTREISSEGRKFLAKWRHKLGDAVVLSGEEATKILKVPGLEMIEARNEISLILDALGGFPGSEGRPEKVLEGTDSVKTFLKPVLDESFDTLLTELNSKIRNLTQKGNTLSLYKTCSETIIYIMSIALVGKDLANDKELTDTLADFSLNIDLKMKGILAWRFFPIIGNYLSKYFARSLDSAPKVRAIFQKKTCDFNLQRRNISLEKRLTPVSFLEAMIDHGLDDKTIADALMVLTFAAMFTTTGNCQRVLSDLISFPENFTAIRNEINSVLPGKEVLLSNKISSLVHIDSTIRETLRHRAHIPELWRKSSSPLALGNGMVIPANTLIAVDIPYIHFNPSTYGKSPHKSDVDPVIYAEQYDPFRFVNTSQNASKLTPNFYSFGTGKHACPGRFFAVQMLTAVVANVIQNYKIETIDGSLPPFITQEDYFPNYSVHLTPV